MWPSCLALAGLDRRDEFLREVDWLRRSPVYNDDPSLGPHLAEGCAQILAWSGEAGDALDEIEKILDEPSRFSVQMLRLDPLWDPIERMSGSALFWKKYADALPEQTPSESSPSLPPRYIWRREGTHRGQIERPNGADASQG